MTINTELRSDAAFSSPPGIYRYSLWRSWHQKPKSICVFIGLNPSTATKHTDDPTIRRCSNFAKSWGYDAMEVVNLFAYRATKPQDLFKAMNVVGPQNDEYIFTACQRATEVVAAWGNHGSFQNRNAEVIDKLSIQFELNCLGVNKQGDPKHPLYLPKQTRPRKWII